MLENRNVLLGVSGGIAAYKSADLVRRLKEAGATVRVVMTEGAQAFITPLTMQAVSGERVATSLLDEEAEAAMGHIELARWADLVVVAPASANVIARLAAGVADDLLSTLCLATEAPIALAPAMNRVMWANPAVRENCERLLSRKMKIWGPASGDQACGEIGEGRMLEPLDIVARVADMFGPRLLEGRKVVITAGPTREAIDPVRYITNRSSGRMGYAVAQACVSAGASVVLVSGPVWIAPPAVKELIRVEDAKQMYEAVMQHIEGADIFVAAAAVADYRVDQVAEQKIKKTDDSMTLTLARNPDILASVAALENKPFCVGFAAETQDLATYAKDKLARKGLDMIAANDVSQSAIGFDASENALHVFWPGGETEIAQADKSNVARSLIELIADKYKRTT